MREKAWSCKQKVYLYFTEPLYFILRYRTENSSTKLFFHFIDSRCILQRVGRGNMASVTTFYSIKETPYPISFTFRRIIEELRVKWRNSTLRFSLPGWENENIKYFIPPWELNQQPVRLQNKIILSLEWESNSQP